MDEQQEERAKPAEQDQKAEVDAAPQEKAATEPVRRWTLIVLAIIFALLVWYLSADRFTPFTSQARVDTYVIPIAPQVTGDVVSVSVVNNQQVNPGDELLRLNSTDYELAANRARADLGTAQQQLAAAKTAVESARASLTSAEANFVRAEKDANRLQRIFDEDPGAISQRRLEIADASQASSQAAVVAAGAGVEQAIQQVGREQAGVVAAQAALEQAEVNFQRTRVLAPASGLVTDLQVDVGNLAQAGQPLMTFVGINDVWIQADFRENNLGHMEPGATAEIVLDVQPGRVFKGRVRSIGFGVGSGSGTALGQLPTIENDRNWLRDAQRFPVIVELNREEIDETLGLRVGGQATVMVYTGQGFLLAPLGKLYMRLVALFSYAY